MAASLTCCLLRKALSCQSYSHFPAPFISFSPSAPLAPQRMEMFYSFKWFRSLPTTMSVLEGRSHFYSGPLAHSRCSGNVCRVNLSLLIGSKFCPRISELGVPLEVSGSTLLFCRWGREAQRRAQTAQGSRACCLPLPRVLAGVCVSLCLSGPMAGPHRLGLPHTRSLRGPGALGSPSQPLSWYLVLQ